MNNIACALHLLDGLRNALVTLSDSEGSGPLRQREILRFAQNDDWADVVTCAVHLVDGLSGTPSCR